MLASSLLLAPGRLQHAGSRMRKKARSGVQNLRRASIKNERGLSPEKKLTKLTKERSRTNLEEKSASEKRKKNKGVCFAAYNIHIKQQ